MTPFLPIYISGRNLEEMNGDRYKLREDEESYYSKYANIKNRYKSSTKYYTEAAPQKQTILEDKLSKPEVKDSSKKITGHSLTLPLTPEGKFDSHNLNSNQFLRFSDAFSLQLFINKPRKRRNS